MITILGSNGQMGLRYQSILRHLEQPFVGIDVQDRQEARQMAIKNSSHVIVATPTDWHLTHMLECIQLNPKIRVLCEKPITKDKSWMLDNLGEIDLTMQMQYQELCHSKSRAYSVYDYFRHGNDGLVWDCFQIIALSQGELDLFERSPVWQCIINGQRLNLSDMDGAYVSYVRKWLGGYKSDLKQLKEWHQKVLDYASKYNPR